MDGVPRMIRGRHAVANGLYLDLIATLTPELLRSKLPGLPSSPIANHLWCVVGARESYIRAARAGQWQGFACSLSGNEDEDPDAVAAALDRSAAAVAGWLGELPADDAESWDWAVRLLEHETQHHGQLIRYLYALRLPIPPSWAERYALD